MAGTSAAPPHSRNGGGDRSVRAAPGRTASSSGQSMASEWLEALVQNNEDDASNLGAFFASRERRGRADGATEGGTGNRNGVGSGDGGGTDIENGRVDTYRTDNDRNGSGGRTSCMKRASFPDKDGISSLLTKQHQAAKNRAVSASRKRRSRWILSRDGSQTGRESHSSWNSSVLDSRGGYEGKLWHSDNSSGSSGDESLDELEHYRMIKTATNTSVSYRTRHTGGMIRSSDQDQDGLRLDHSTTLLQLQHREKIRDAHWLLARFNNCDSPLRIRSASRPPSSSDHNVKQNSRNRYQMNQFARNNDEREHGSRQLYDAYADTVATESKLRTIVLHEEDTVRKALMQDLQNQLNLQLSSANACLAGAVSDAVGDGEEAKHADLMQALQRIAVAQKRQHFLSQQFQNIRNRLDDVLTNATPLPGSLNNERGKRRRTRDRLRQQLGTMLERQQEDRDKVRALKETAKQIRLQIRQQQDDMEKVRTAWNLATDGLPQSRSLTPASGYRDVRPSKRINWKATRGAAAAVQERGGFVKSPSPSRQRPIHNHRIRSPTSRSRSRNGGHSRSQSRSKTRGSSRSSTRQSEVESPLHVTARDVETGSPLHASDMQNTLSLEQSADKCDEDSGEDEEELEWKEFEIRNNTSVGLAIMPQEYVDAQFAVRLRSCQTGFREIEKELRQTVLCDVCSKVLTNPRITRACSHIMCFRCLGTKRPGANASHPTRKDAPKSNKIDDSHIVCPVCGTVTEARSDGIMSLLQAKLVPFHAAANTSGEKGDDGEMD